MSTAKTAQDTAEEPTPELLDALLRVYLHGFGSGYASALVQAGAPPILARHLSAHTVDAIKDDPIPRNVAVDDALRLFRGEGPDETRDAITAIPINLSKRDDCP